MKGNNLEGFLLMITLIYMYGFPTRLNLLVFNYAMRKLSMKEH